MPFELELEEVAGVVLDAAPPDELEDCVDGVVDVVDEPEELEPHAATPSATSTSSAAAHRRGDLVMVVFISCSFGVGPGRSGSLATTPSAVISFPETLAVGEPAHTGRKSRRRRPVRQSIVITADQLTRGIALTAPPLARVWRGFLPRPRLAELWCGLAPDPSKIDNS